MFSWGSARRAAAGLRDVADESTRKANRSGSLDGDGLDPRRRDPKKLLLIVGLSLLAWISTYTGMLELIQANLGEVGLVEKVAIGMAVAMLQIMIVWLLDQLFSPINAGVKALYVVGYLFLTLISVGFAFGFYWKVLESRSEATRSAETSFGQVQTGLNASVTRLEQLTATLTALTTISNEKAAQEAANGNSCPGSRPGQGPRMAMRKADAERFQFASNFVQARVDQVKADVKILDSDLQKILKDDKSIVDSRTGTRNDFIRNMGRKLDEVTVRYNALRTDPQLRQVRADLAERAEKTTFADTRNGTYSCPDPQLQSALRGVVAAIDGLPMLEKPKVTTTEGSEAVIEAFRRLTTTLFGVMQFKLPPSPEELRDQQRKAVQSVETSEKARPINLDGAGLGKRDYIPLGIAIFVDFCILLVSVGRPVNRFVMAKSQMREAEAGPVNQILANFHDIHDDRAIRRHFEVFRHVIFSDWLGRYYVAVPLSAPRRDENGKPMQEIDRELLLTQSQMLANLFSSLEEGNIIAPRSLSALPFIGGLLQWSVRRRLKQQDSKFARARAFRIYKFKNRAWPEMILGAVMGAAKQHERELAEKREFEKQIEATERQAEAELRIAAADLKRREAELKKLEVQQRKAEIERQMESAKMEAAVARNTPPRADVDRTPSAMHAPYYEDRGRTGRDPAFEPDFAETLRSEVGPFVTAHRRAGEQERAWREAAAPVQLNNGHHNGHSHPAHEETAARDRILLEVPRDTIDRPFSRASLAVGPIPPVRPANRNTGPAPQPTLPVETQDVPAPMAEVHPPVPSETAHKAAASEAIGIVRSVIAVNEAVNGRLMEKVSEFEKLSSEADPHGKVIGIENGAALAEHAQWDAVPPAWDGEQRQALLPGSSARENGADQEPDVPISDPSTIAKRFARQGK